MAERTKFDRSTGVAEDVDWEDREPDEPTPLTDEQKATLLAQVRKARENLVPVKQHFGEATTWVLYVFGWMILKDDPDVPLNYGARFADFGKYVLHRRAERAQEELDDEENGPAYA